MPFANQLDLGVFETQAGLYIPRMPLYLHDIHIYKYVHELNASTAKMLNAKDDLNEHLLLEHCRHEKDLILSM